MSSSVSAVSNFASVPSTTAVASDSAQYRRSSGNPHNFSEMLRGTADGRRSTEANRSGEADKKDKKSGKKDSDTDTAASTAIIGSTLPEKSSLPITLLFGLPVEALQSFDGQQGAASSHTAIVAKAPTFSGLPNNDRDPRLLMAQTPDLANAVLPDLAPSSQKSDTDVKDSKDSQLLAIEGNGNAVKGAAGVLSSNTLAFAMRLGNGQAPNASKVASSAESVKPVQSDNLRTDSPAITSSTVQAASGSLLEENTREHDEPAQAQNVTDLSAVRISEPFDATKIAEENTRTTAPEAPLEPSTPVTAEPVRNVHMQLVSDDNRRVDVRLVDRGGELHVSVRSVDAALTQNLQDHLPELTARLERQHMQTEVWVPKTTEPSKADGGNTNSSLSDSNTPSYSGNSESKKDGRQQRKPDWVDALENYS